MASCAFRLIGAGVRYLILSEPGLVSAGPSPEYVPGSPYCCLLASRQVGQKDLDRLFLTALIARYRAQHRVSLTCYARAADCPAGAVEGTTTYPDSRPIGIVNYRTPAPIPCQPQLIPAVNRPPVRQDHFNSINVLAVSSLFFYPTAKALVGFEFGTFKTGPGRGVAHNAARKSGRRTRSDTRRSYGELSIQWGLSQPRTVSFTSDVHG
jgi:hypothetical protein